MAKLFRYRFLISSVFATMKVSLFLSQYSTNSWFSFVSLFRVQSQIKLTFLTQAGPQYHQPTHGEPYYDLPSARARLTLLFNPKTNREVDNTSSHTISLVNQIIAVNQKVAYTASYDKNFEQHFGREISAPALYRAECKTPLQLVMSLDAQNLR